MPIFKGYLDVHSKGFGFLRDPRQLHMESDQDPYVPHEVIRKYRLKSGLYIEGECGTGKNGKPVLKSVEIINGEPAADFRQSPPFHQLTTISPDRKIKLETKGGPISTRALDLLSPIGKGSRSLIVAPPKVGKTTLLKEIVAGVTTNHPEIQVIALLVDERPEEVTDMERSIKGTVYASSMDQSIGNHVRLVRLVAEIVKRKVEGGADVLVVLDSITRVSRAFNNYGSSESGGRTMSGGLDSRAMEFPRSFFGSARNIEGGGSLTIVGTALVDTGSKMDELIYQEFKGTGNQEIVLNRRLADKRIFPALNLAETRTRREELLLSARELEATSRLRRALIDLQPDVSMMRFLETLSKYDTNSEFVEMILSAKVKKFTED